MGCWTAHAQLAADTGVHAQLAPRVGALRRMPPARPTRASRWHPPHAPPPYRHASKPRTPPH
ncbi:hypothetical protein U9M48_034801 [Paspalum notatum var. saurae]|uniref:Uncharacterized protein n=1 Tax=Paspalum notatum var. saurae TaxID=547442 RepID=A0AAQ3UAP1_PASNO